MIVSSVGLCKSNYIISVLFHLIHICSVVGIGSNIYLKSRFDPKYKVKKYFEFSKPEWLILTDVTKVKKFSELRVVNTH